MGYLQAGRFASVQDVERRIRIRSKSAWFERRDKFPLKEFVHHRNSLYQDVRACMKVHHCHVRHIYHMSNVWESMGKPCSCTLFIKSRICNKSHENPYQYYKSRENPYQVLQVTCAASERAMKSKVHMIKSLSP